MQQFSPEVIVRNASREARLEVHPKARAQSNQGLSRGARIFSRRPSGGCGYNEPADQLIGIRETPIDGGLADPTLESAVLPSLVAC